MRELRWAGREGRYRALEIRYRNGRWTRMPLAGSEYVDAGMFMSMCVAERRLKRRWNEFVIFHSDSSRHSQYSDSTL